MTKGPKTHHVVPNSGRGGWDVKRGGAEKSSGHYETKQQAVDAGRTISRHQHTELRIHTRDGRIASSDSHGPDPKNVQG